MENLEKQVLVQLDRATGALTITPDSFPLRDREWVRWTFEGLQGNEFGFISFAQEHPRFGPFASLRTFDSRSVLGKGNKGDLRSYVYRALVLDLDNPEPVASSKGTIENQTAHKNPAPEIYVTYHPGNPPTLEVSPDPVGLNTGDTATWHFVNLPANAFACFNFANQKLGPFIAFSAGRTDDACTVDASGTGFAVTVPDEKELTYHIELRDWEGYLLASHDPQIDNLGPPPTTNP